MNSAVGHLGADGEVRGHAEAEAGLAHARAGGDDDQVPRLEPGSEPVEVAEAGRRARDVCAGFVEGGDALEAVLQQLLDVAELARDARLREVEDDLLGAVDEVRGLAGPLPAQLGDLAARPNQPAEGRHLAHDARVVPRVRAGGNEGRELVDANAAARALELPALLELVDERDRVDGLALRVQRQRGAVDDGVALAVEVARVQHFADRPDRAGGEHHRAEDRFLSFEILRRDRGGRRGLGELGHRATQARRARSWKVWTTPLSTGPYTVGRGRFAGIREHRFPRPPDDACGRNPRSEREVRSEFHSSAPSCGEACALLLRVGLLGVAREARPRRPRPGRTRLRGPARPPASASGSSSSSSARRRPRSRPRPARARRPPRPARLPRPPPLPRRSRRAPPAAAARRPRGRPRRAAWRSASPNSSTGIW